VPKVHACKYYTHYAEDGPADAAMAPPGAEPFANKLGWSQALKTFCGKFAYN
jgi:hypothetical protein